MRISDWSSDVCSSDLACESALGAAWRSAWQVSLVRVALLALAAGVLTLAGQGVGGEDGQEGHGDDEDRNHVGHRALARAHQLAHHPDPPGRLLARREGGNYDPVEADRTTEHDPGPSPGHQAGTGTEADGRDGGAGGA